MILTLVALLGNSGPSGPPLSLSYEQEAGCVVMLSWQPGDPAAETNVYQNGVLYDTTSEGVYTLDVADPGAYNSVTYEVRHLKNGVESTGSSAVVPGRDEC